MLKLALALLLPQAAALAVAAPPPATAPAARSWPTHEADVTFRDFRFTSGESLPELRIHYTTLGTPHRNAKREIDNAVLILHGTGGTGKQFLVPQFADELYGPGQPLDINRYFIILPDDIGHGGSSKPSDGLRARFPHYAYTDMVEAERRLVASLGIKRLRLVMGTSMGCMHSFIWGTIHPEMVQAAMPLACLPVEIAGRNRIWRKMAIDAIRADPGYDGGNYTTEPMQGLRTAGDLLIIAGLNPIAAQAEDPTREQAEADLARRFDRIVAGRDGNDLIWQLDSSRDYDPSAGLERMTMPVTWINSADDFINPPGLGIAEKMIKHLPQGRFVLIPGSAETKGHGTHTWAKFWKGELADLLRRSEKP